jgi:hypothetical protein
MAYVQPTLGEMGKKPGRFRKLLRKVGAVAAGATGGLVPFVKPKMLGVKSKSGKKYFRIGRVVGGVTAAVFAAPFLIAKMGGPAGLTKMGSLKFLGGKLVSGPASLMAKMKSKGIDPKTATTQQVIDAGKETGDVTDSMLENVVTLAKNMGIQIPGQSQEGPTYPGGTSYPSRPPSEGGGGEGYTTDGSSTGGMFETVKPMLPWIGAGIVAIAVLPSLLKGRSK